MKKSIVILLLLAGISLQASAGINEKLLKTFNQTFPAAVSVSWQEMDESYVVNFMEGNTRSRITYDKEGNFLSSLRYYTEQNLPLNILCKLKKKYAGEKIFGVTEKSTDANVEYYVKLQNDTYWITVKFDGDGNMEQVEKYKKTE